MASNQALPPYIINFPKDHNLNIVENDPIGSQDKIPCQKRKIKKRVHYLPPH